VWGDEPIWVECIVRHVTEINQATGKMTWGAHLIADGDSCTYQSRFRPRLQPVFIAITCVYLVDDPCGRHEIPRRPYHHLYRLFYPANFKFKIDPPLIRLLTYTMWNQVPQRQIAYRIVLLWNEGRWAWRCPARQIGALHSRGTRHVQISASVAVTTACRIDL
jgi:hypothetical protein